MERNLLTTFFKILSAKNILLFLPYIIMARFLAIVKDRLSFNFSNAFSRLKAMLFIIFNFTFIMKKRRETQKFRRSADKYILEVFEEGYLFRPKFIV